MANNEYKDLLANGWEVVAYDQTPTRLLVGSQGRERTGKTTWACATTPGPVGYVGLDFGHEGVINKAAQGRDILGWYMNIPPVGTQDKYGQFWTAVDTHIQQIMQHPKIRTVVLDSGSDIWELLRLAQFGKLNQTGDIKKLYPQINQAYRSLIKMAYDREINLVVTHKVKKHYSTRTVQTQRGAAEQEYWDGQSYERAGFGEGGYLVQVQIEHIFDPDRKGDLSNKFGFRILDCRQNMDVVGTELWGPDNNFATLAQYVFPDSSESDWR